MRVLLMDVNCKYSSTGKIVYDLYTKLREDGYEAAIAYGRGTIVDEENIYRFSPQWEVYLHALLTRITGYTSCFSYIATRRAIRYIEKFQPDVVHLHDMHGYFINIIPLVEYLKKKQIKTVWTFHCEYMYTGKCGHAYECEKWKTECDKCPQIREYPKSFLIDRTSYMFRQKKDILQDWDKLTIVTPSGWLQDRVRQSFLMNREIAVVFNGLDIKIFRPRECKCVKENIGLKEEKIVLAVASNLMSEAKGGKYVLELAKRMESQRNIKFLLIGTEDSSKYYGKNIINIGVISDSDLLAKYYSIADLFLICSKRETFSMTTIEALCCGTPVVGFEAGAPETIALNNCSIFVPQGDINKLEKALVDVLNGAIKLSRSEISMLAEKNYAKQIMCQNYLELYKK